MGFIARFGLEPGRPAVLLMGGGSGVGPLADLAERRELRVAVVRGFDYGEPYMELLKTLRAA